MPEQRNVSDDALDGFSAAPVDIPTRDEKIEPTKAQIDDTPTESAPSYGILTKRKPLWWHRHLESEERHRILAELGIKRQPGWGFRFSTMLALSVIVAVMGMSADSAAVVIGAMLLAPLMQPVLAAAACIAMALFRKSLTAAGHILFASIGAIALAYVLSALFVNGDLPSEVTSRTAPDIRDLVVALAAGTAGAYATVRTDVSSSLPGVAVAVALVPPIAAVGITLETGNETLARGALLLYATNLAAIVFAALIVFVATGFVPPRRLATTFPRTAAVSAIVALTVIAIAVPLYRASVSAAQDTDRELEAKAIVDNWLGQIKPANTPTVAFNNQRILVRVRSFEDPVDDQPLTEALQLQFGDDRIVSLEWEKLARFETTTTIAPTTTVLTGAERLADDVEKIIDEWLQDGDFDGVRRVDALIIGDGVVRIDASGAGNSPPIEDLTTRLDAALDETLEVQLTWVERRNVTSDAGPTADELLEEQIVVISEEWARATDVTVLDVAYDGLDAVIQLAAETQPDATDFVNDVEALLPDEAGVRVLFIRRLDITTTTTTTTTTTSPTSATGTLP